MPDRRASTVASVFLCLVLLQGVDAFFGRKPPPPPPPPPSPPLDVLSVLVALILILGATLAYRLRTVSASDPAPVSSSVITAPPAEAKVSKDAALFPRGPLLILWGSQTGTAEGFGNELMREARAKGFNAKSVDLEEYTGEDLAKEGAPVVFLMSTHGEGEPTDNAVEFYTWANSAERSASDLARLRFATFALGNTQYEHYCFMGKWAQARLAELGAAAICELGMGNDDDDIRGDFDSWCSGALWPALTGAAAGEGAVADAASAPEANFDAVFSGADGRPLEEVAPTPPTPGPSPPSSSSAPPLAWLDRAFPKLALFECTVAACRELTSDPSQDSGSVKHVELSCAARRAPDGAAATLHYEAADDLGVCCDGGVELAASAAAQLGLRLDATFTLVARRGGAAGDAAAAAAVAPPLPTPCTVEHALRYYADLRAPVSKQMLALLASAATDPTEADRLRHLATAGGKAEYAAYIVRDGRGLCELLRTFASARPPLGALLELAPKLTPRYYTISSSPLAAGGTVHLTVKVLREPMRGAEGRTKEGVCSTQLGDLKPGGRAIVFVRPSAFRLPADPAAPVLMVGPGTGVAPFRAFAQQLVAQRQRGAASGGKAARTGEVRLYFGCRRPAVDFLYADELRAAERSGALTALRTAFSRETSTKIYVQDRLREDAAVLHRLMSEEGAYVYICGGTQMGREVVGLLTQMYVDHGGASEAEAAAAVKQMTKEGRLVQELWS